MCLCSVVYKCRILNIFDQRRVYFLNCLSLTALNQSDLLVCYAPLSFVLLLTHKCANSHTHIHKYTTLHTSLPKARKTNMPIFLFDWVSVWGARGTGVMHKMTLRLHHRHDSFMVRRCFNQATALEGINQYTHAGTHTHTHQYMLTHSLHVDRERAAERF